MQCPCGRGTKAATAYGAPPIRQGWGYTASALLRQPLSSSLSLTYLEYDLGGAVLGNGRLHGLVASPGRLWGVWLILYVSSSVARRSAMAVDDGFSRMQWLLDSKLVITREG